MPFVQACISSDTALMAILKHRPDAIVHCAGTSLVGPSIKYPNDYYENNFVNTKRLLDFVVSALPKTRIIFSSSAAVYGEPILTPCEEVDPANPISPYGHSKLMVEWLMESYHQAYGLNYVAFRYFNACGADPQSQHGQAPGATHIIARVLESIRDNQEFTLYGNTYPTADGTCVRDYVHVDDIAQAHVLALSEMVPIGIYNLGSNAGTSNHEIILAAQRITGQQLKITVGAQRNGDPAVLTACDNKFKALFPDWRQWSLDDMIGHAWNWYNQKR
jgi:UDP-glucose-4-epimerase GalE